MRDPKPLMLAGTSPVPYVERVPVLGGTRLHWVSPTVDGRPFEYRHQLARKRGQRGPDWASQLRPLSHLRAAE